MSLKRTPVNLLTTCQPSLDTIRKQEFVSDYAQNAAEAIVQKVEHDKATANDDQRKRVLKEEAKAALDAELRRKAEASKLR